MHAASWVLRTSGYDMQVHAFPAEQVPADGRAFLQAACDHTVPAELASEASGPTPTCVPCLIKFGATEADRMIAHSQRCADQQIAELNGL